ncbi:MAG: hypothetical protein ABSC30_05650 [Acidimicrobiales bacterium]|jgi:hypothetical protein
MKGRTVNFFIEPEALPEVLRAIDEDVLPRFRALPHFVGVVVLQSERGARIEVAGISLWDGDLEESEEIASEFRREVQRVAGTGAARTAYEVIRLELRDVPGDFSG